MELFFVGGTHTWVRKWLYTDGQFLDCQMKGCESELFEILLCVIFCCIKRDMFLFLNLNFFVQSEREHFLHFILLVVLCNSSLLSSFRLVNLTRI